MASVNRIITVILYVVLDISDIRSMIKGHWNWYSISRCISMKEVRDHPDLAWTKACLSINPTLELSDLDIKILDQDDEWESDRISSSINMEQVRENIYLIWDRHSLSYNPTLTFDVVKLDLPNTKGKMGLETDKSTTSTI